MPDMMLSSGAGGRVRLYMEYRQTNPNRCVVEAIRGENDHQTAIATYALSYRNNQVHSLTFPPMQITRQVIPGNITLALITDDTGARVPDMGEVTIGYSGPME